MRFFIRDLLWLTVVVAVAIGTGTAWRTERREMLAKQLILIQQQQDAIVERKFVQAENRALTIERDEVRAEVRAFVAMLQKERREKDEVQYRAKLIAQHAPRPSSDGDIEAAKTRSIELGAPQPKPLPRGYGDKPN
jgi:hypothetical protein